jgi:putative membrane protein
MPRALQTWPPSSGCTMAIMPVLAQAAALLAALIHISFLLLESVLFERPDVWRRFGLASAEQASVVRPMAFNQGFYNLFLALGILAGLVLVETGNPVAGKAIVMFACAAVVGAGAVLLATSRRFLVSAVIQAGPPLVALIAAALL